MSVGRCRLLTPTPGSGPAAAGAIATILIEVGEATSMEALLGWRVAPGEVALRDLFGVDTGLVARWGSKVVWVMPHGGAQVVRRLMAALEARGVRHDSGIGAARLYPEARSSAEALALEALSWAASPRAAPVLLEQAGRWERGEARMAREAEVALSRLLRPPVVVALGPANVGKSTLANRLAGREVSLVADVPGTTRDHVGVGVVLDGLAVHWVDLPGVRPDADALEEEAWRLAAPVLASADLVVSCGDATSPAPEPRALGVSPATPVLRCGLRCDLGVGEGADVAVSALDGTGVADLGRLVRGRLVSDEALGAGGCWRFHEGLGDVRML